MAGKRRSIILHSLDEVPRSFASEAEEREFWDAHSFGPELLAQTTRGAWDNSDLPPVDPRRGAVLGEEQPVPLQHIDGRLGHRA